MISARASCGLVLALASAQGCGGGVVAARSQPTPTPTLTQTLTPTGAPNAELAAVAIAGARPQECRSCHPEIVEEWRSSGHARAWTDPLVQEELRPEEAAPCIACHAPSAPLGELPVGRAASDGIDCSACHEQATHGDSGGASHAGSSSVGSSGGEVCGGCHQFRFLEATDPEMIAYADGWLQDTVGEWSRSDAARRGITCQDCHMPRRGQHRSHRFPGMYDRELVASAVEVEVGARRRGGRVRVDVSIAGGAIGHAFPTGDLFREAVFRVWTEEARSDHAQTRLRRWFGDRMAPTEEGTFETTRVELRDTRVPPPGGGPPRTEVFYLRSRAARTVVWSLDLYARDPGLSSPPVVTPVATGRVSITTGDPAMALGTTR